MPKSLKNNGAGGRNRTDMGLLPRDFESRASTNFTTPALIWSWIFLNYIEDLGLSRKIT